MLISFEYGSHQVRSAYVIDGIDMVLRTFFVMFVDLKPDCETNQDNTGRKNTWIRALINRRGSEDFRHTHKCKEIGCVNRISDLILDNPCLIADNPLK